MHFDYDIALSFAGEDRPIAQEIANSLKSKGVSVFYDEFEEAKLWGEDLYTHLHEVYSKRARYCMILISANYTKKAWTNHEIKSAQERAFKESHAYILPVRLDATTIPGMRDTVGYINLKNKNIDELVNLTLIKLDMQTFSQPEIVQNQTPNTRTKIPLPKIKKPVTNRDKDNFIDRAFVVIRSYFQENLTHIGHIPRFEVEFKEVTPAKFLSGIYIEGQCISACTIWYDLQLRSGGIKYSTESNPNASSPINEILAVEVCNGKLLLRSMLSQQKLKFSTQDATNYLWSKLVEPLEQPIHLKGGEILHCFIDLG